MTTVPIVISIKTMHGETHPVATIPAGTPDLVAEIEKAVQEAYYLGRLHQMAEVGESIRKLRHELKGWSS